MENIVKGTRIEFTKTGAVMEVTYTDGYGMTYRWVPAWTAYRMSFDELRMLVNQGLATILPAPESEPPFCEMCSGPVSIGTLTCDRCRRVQAYAIEINSTFTGWQGRNAVMRDRLGNEFIVWSETFDAPLEPRPESRKAAAMGETEFRVGQHVWVKGTGINRYHGVIVGTEDSAYQVRLNNGETWTFTRDALYPYVAPSCSFKRSDFDAINIELSDAAFERWGRPSYAEVRAELDAMQR